MKVVQLSSVHYVFDNRIFNKITKSLVNNGYDVDLLIQHAKDEVVEGVNIIALPKVTGKLSRLFKVLPVLVKKVLDYPPETIFHFHDPELIPVGLLLKFFGYKVIYDVHEDVPKDILTKEWIPRLGRYFISNLIDLIEKSVSKKLDGVVTVVPSITERFKTANVVELRNYPSIKSTNGFAKQSENKGFVIYVGSLTERRGITEMVDAIDKVKYSEIELLLGGAFIGDGLLQNLKQRKGWNKVNFLGWIEKECLIPTIKGGIAGLLTLREIPSHIDSLPVKMFEYMFAGIPVIASDFKFWETFVLDNNCGLLVDPSNPQEIADAIEWIYENPAEAKKMGMNGKKAVIQKYNWSSQENKLLTLYKSLT
ncbi:MAG: glycosyltransferase family 4 protein [Balneola sp.]|jgi:glycosyltransferase involved in cell wall biosynthesis